LGNLTGKTALVTGSSRSLGKAIALALADAGANVVVNHRASPAEAEAVAKEIRAKGVKSMVVQADVSKRADVEAMGTQVHTQLGPIDILVNNVGVSPMVPFLQMKDEDWHQVVGINLHSFFYVTQTFIKDMVDKKWGRVINVTGHAGLRGTPFAAHTCASKLAVHGFTHSLASEFAQHGITVNTMAPGSFDTEDRHVYYTQMRGQLGGEWEAQWHARIPLRREGKPEEFASMCVYLCSEGASFVTGQTFLINGGMMYS
jgi:NAD(P)-dependent dehydrogenase (short-subunit alcohol dehydrogenase family)